MERGIQLNEALFKLRKNTSHNNNNNNNNNLNCTQNFPKNVTKQKEIKNKIRVLAAWNNHKG